MGRAVRIHSQDQYLDALRVLDRVKGTWRGIGPSSDPVLLLTEDQFQALVDAGVVAANGKEVDSRGKKASTKS